MPAIAASEIQPGVSKSGSPALRSMMSLPSAASFFARALTAMVAEGCNRDMFWLYVITRAANQRGGPARCRGVAGGLELGNIETRHGASNPAQVDLLRSHPPDYLLPSAGCRSLTGTRSTGGMGQIRIEFTFDYVDPGSYLAHRILSRWARGQSRPISVRWTPLELRTPAMPQIDPEEREWSALLAEMESVAQREGILFARPVLVPWTRKAHELALHAREKGHFEEVHDALFDAYFARGLDIGRVDALVELAEGHGLSAAETRTVLGVDRFAPEVETDRRAVIGGGTVGVPTIEAAGRRLEGFESAEDLLAFLREAEGADDRE
ncbi:MAG: hypothetical protein EXR92_02335 [Gemmatimonadetes bacterium]|nr:hypothetical protein [Gemmatimonadota bacterium]